MNKNEFMRYCDSIVRGASDEQLRENEAFAFFFTVGYWDFKQTERYVVKDDAIADIRDELGTRNLQHERGCRTALEFIEECL